VVVAHSEQSIVLAELLVLIQFLTRSLPQVVAVVDHLAPLPIFIMVRMVDQVAAQVTLTTPQVRVQVELEIHPL
jgi:hypothetical protein